MVALWGSAYGFNRVAIANISPMIIVAIRLWVGALLIGIIGKFMGVKMPSFANYRAWASMAATGIIGSLIPFFLVVKAQTYVPSAIASIYLAATPLSVALMAHFLIKGEKINIRSFAGILLGILGVVVLFLPNILSATSIKSPLWAQLFLVGAAFCYGIALIIVRLTSPNIHPIATSFGFVLCSAIVSTPFALFMPHEVLNHNYNETLSYLCAIALGIGPTALASILYVSATHRIGPVMVANVSNLVPFFSLLVGFFVFQENIPPTAIFALIIILTGVYLLKLGSQKRAG